MLNLGYIENKMSNAEQGVTRTIGCKSQANKIRILKDVSGIIKPSRLIHMHRSNTCILIFFLFIDKRGTTKYLVTFREKTDPVCRKTG